MSIEWIFIGSIVIYAILIGLVCFWYSKSDDQRVAHENLPKTIKHITEGFVTVVIFLLMFHLAIARIIPTDVLITLIAVFSTAGFLSLKNK